MKINTKALETFIKKANRKLLDIEIAQSIKEIKEGKTKVYNSSSDFLKHIKSRLA